MEMLTLDVESLSSDLIVASDNQGWPPVGRTPDVQHSGSVYLSGPITGETYTAARYGWRKYVADRLAPGIKVLSPMRHEGHLAEITATLEKEYPEHFFSQPRIL